MSQTKTLLVNPRVRTVTALSSVVLCAGIGLLVVSQHFTPANGVATTRGIRTDERVDLPLDPGHPDAPKPSKPLASVRVGVRNDASSQTASLVSRIAPIEMTDALQRPDLVWDATARTLSQNDDVVAYDVAAADIPAAADRFALMREVRDESQTAQQAVRLQPDDKLFHAGQRVSVLVADAKDRNAVVFVVSGNGVIEFLYPVNNDIEPVLSADLTLPVDVSDPFGVDQVVAVTSTQTLDDFARAVRRFDRRRASGEVLGLLETLPPGSIKVGTVGITTQP